MEGVDDDVWKQFLEECDQDNDGKISEEEFINLLSDKFWYFQKSLIISTSAASAILSIEDSSYPLFILNLPFSPHYFPQLFYSNQYFIPSSSPHP